MLFLVVFSLLQHRTIRILFSIPKPSGSGCKVKSTPPVPVCGVCSWPPLPWRAHQEPGLRVRLFALSGLTPSDTKPCLRYQLNVISKCGLWNPVDTSSWKTCNLNSKMIWGKRLLCKLRQFCWQVKSQQAHIHCNQQQQRLSPKDYPRDTAYGCPCHPQIY